MTVGALRTVRPAAGDAGPLPETANSGHVACLRAAFWQLRDAGWQVDVFDIRPATPAARVAGHDTDG